MRDKFNAFIDNVFENVYVFVLKPVFLLLLVVFVFGAVSAVIFHIGAIVLAVLYGLT
jgi:hypothetical protein